MKCQFHLVLKIKIENYEKPKTHPSCNCNAAYLKLLFSKMDRLNIRVIENCILLASSRQNISKKDLQCCTNPVIILGKAHLNSSG